MQGAYLYCQTADNQQSVFRAAHHLISGSHTSKILVLNTEAKFGYPGYADWEYQLAQQGVYSEQLEGISYDVESGLNTLIESQSLVRYLKLKNYSSIFVVAAPFQQLRVFMTAVTVAIKEYPELLIYSYPGVSMPWTEEVTHSQGTLRAKRHELIQTELSRIKKYQDKGDLASSEQVLSYLNRREKSLFPATR
jgi:hypothetical protein